MEKNSPNITDNQKEPLSKEQRSYSERALEAITFRNARMIGLAALFLANSTGHLDTMDTVSKVSGIDPAYLNGSKEVNAEVIKDGSLDRWNTFKSDVGDAFEVAEDLIRRTPPDKDGNTVDYVIQDNLDKLSKITDTISSDGSTDQGGGNDYPVSGDMEYPHSDASPVSTPDSTQDK